MIALVDLHGAAVRVREDDPTSASSMLVLAKDPRLDLLQRVVAIEVIGFDT